MKCKDCSRHLDHPNQRKIRAQLSLEQQLDLQRKICKECKSKQWCGLADFSRPSPLPIIILNTGKKRGLNLHLSPTNLNQFSVPNHSRTLQKSPDSVPSNRASPFTAKPLATLTRKKGRSKGPISLQNTLYWFLFTDKPLASHWQTTCRFTLRNGFGWHKLYNWWFRNGQKQAGINLQKLVKKGGLNLRLSPLQVYGQFTVISLPNHSPPITKPLAWLHIKSRVIIHWQTTRRVNHKKREFKRPNFPSKHPLL